jgi:hypothetical protein
MTRMSELLVKSDQLDRYKEAVNQSEKTFSPWVRTALNTTEKKARGK